MGNGGYGRAEWLEDMGRELASVAAGEYDGVDLPGRFEWLLERYRASVGGAAGAGDASALVPDALVREWAEYRGRPAA